MTINRKRFITFIFSLIILYPIVGYLKSNVGVAIHWVENVTPIQKLNEYYIRTFWDNIIITSVIAIIPTLIIGTSPKKNKQ